MVTAAKCTIVEVEEIVDAGQVRYLKINQILPDEIHTPGVYVDYVFLGKNNEKKIEKIVYDPAS